MALQPITSQEAAHRILSFLKDGRLVQGAWHRQEGARELACMIGAIDPAITSAEQCPSGVMPQWLAYVTVSLFDGQSKMDAMAWAERYAGLMSRWHVLEPDAWQRAEVRFKIVCVRSAIASAEPVCKDQDYWPKVTAAAQQVCDALEGKGELKAAAAAARAAYAAARADADAAAAAAYVAAADAAYVAYVAAAAAVSACAAARADADAAADAAYVAAAAARAAAATARAADAAAAARAAHSSLAAKLLDAIELEVLSAESLAGAV